MEHLSSLINKFCKGEYSSEASENQWCKMFEYILENHEELDLEKEKIHLLWTVNGGQLRNKIRNDTLIANILSLALPSYSGEDLVLYRGECRFLYESNHIGFCWSPSKNVASMFASGLNAIESGGVLLKAYAPKASILTGPNKHSIKQMQEIEYTCNPRLLENIEPIKIYDKLHA